MQELLQNYYKKIMRNLNIENNLKITHIKRCFLISKSAEPAPPLGTILGNLGVIP